MNDKSTIITITGMHIEKAKKETAEFLNLNLDFKMKLEDFRMIGCQSLLQGAPFDFDSQAKLSFHPFNEAATDIDLAIFFLQSGMYKSFYHHIRSFLELYLVAIYFLSPNCSKKDTHEWLDGIRKTPFVKDIWAAVFKEPQFIQANQEIKLQDKLNDIYWRISGFIHNRGESCGHTGVAKANFPRFLEEAFKQAMNDFHECIEIVCVTFALRCPLILKGFPMLLKFGINPPLSGFLDEAESKVVRKYISIPYLEFLNNFCENDEGFKSARDWVMSRPDMTEEQLKMQIEEDDEFSRFFRASKGWKGANVFLTAQQILFQLKTEASLMKQWREASDQVDEIMKNLNITEDD